MKSAAIFLLILLSGLHASGAAGFTFPLEGIDHWTVYYFPERICTRAGLSPDQLRQRAYYTLTIRDRADPRLKDILTSLAQTRAAKQKYGFDARWGIDLFYKGADKPVSISLSIGGAIIAGDRFGTNNLGTLRLLRSFFGQSFASEPQ